MHYCIIDAANISDHIYFQTTHYILFLHYTPGSYSAAGDDLFLNVLPLPLTLMITRQKSSINVGMYREDRPQAREEQ